MNVDLSNHDMIVIECDRLQRAVRCLLEAVGYGCDISLRETFTDPVSEHEIVRDAPVIMREAEAACWSAIREINTDEAREILRQNGQVVG